ncbi:hypothetical protein P7K49_003130 [Saguinus oedipus]|uniref:Bcl-2 Bcl-2 homology region 1-3 domain-containing protein n=1 Tax=Saguinus oedipus TaxID=9490 RepID=A0ABQ9WJA9_SAGOE|nr:hypothetical protein P7K49_003130 [Saguinus oedipus]
MGIQLATASQSLDEEILLKVKTEIEEELKSLDKEISEAFTSTGFDRHTSPVFSPANPESSMEDCLAHLGEKVSQELKEPLHKALHMLLSQPVTYQAFRECTLETAVDASGWNKILVPLVLLRQMLLELTRRGQESLSALLKFGVTYLEDYSAEYIIQQGGWEEKRRENYAFPLDFRCSYDAVHPACGMISMGNVFVCSYLNTTSSETNCLALKKALFYRRKSSRRESGDLSLKVVTRDLCDHRITLLFEELCDLDEMIYLTVTEMSKSSSLFLFIVPEASGMRETKNKEGATDKFCEFRSNSKDSDAQNWESILDFLD